MRRPTLASLLLAAVACAFAPAVGARDGDATGMTLLARLGEGNPNRVVFVPPLAYAALDSGLGIYDLTLPDAPVRVGHLYLASAALDVAVAGNHAYVAAGESGLLVVDVQDPAAPLLVGSLATPGARAVAVAGSVAYLAEASEPPAAASFGLRTVSIATPAVPTPLGFLPLANGALDVEVSSSTAFVGIGSDLQNPSRGLVTIDVSNPAAPFALGLLGTARAVNQVALDRSIVYLATGVIGSGELVVGDVASPATPVLLGSRTLGDVGSGVAVAGTTVWVAAHALGLVAYDVSNPAAPVPAGAWRGSGEVVAVALGGGLGVTGERSSNGPSLLSVLDLSLVSSPRRLGLIASAEATGAAIETSLVYLAARNRLTILDAGTPGAPVPIAEWPAPAGDLSTVAVMDDRLAALGDGRDVRLIDVTNPLTPSECGRLTVSDGTAIGLVFAGSTLHVVTGRGIESFDVSAPAAPRGLGFYPTNGWSSALALDGSVGYLVAGDTLHVLDLAVPASPSPIGSLVIPGERLYGVAVSGPTAVLTGYSSFVYTVDVAAPANPLLRGSLPGPLGFAVKLSGARAVIARGELGLSVVDVTDLANPSLIGGYDTSGVAAALDIDGAVVCAATGPAQHWVLRCDTCMSGCVETWSTIGPNSLRAVKFAGGDIFSWQVLAGNGDFNLHRTYDPPDLPLLWADRLTIAVSGNGNTVVDPLVLPPNEVAYYRVFGRGSCSGNSHER